MSTTASMINLHYPKRLIFAIHVPEWSIQHEIVLNKNSSWVKYPSPKGWDWLKLPLDEDYKIIGLSTAKDLISSDGISLNNSFEILGTIIRSHIITYASKYDVKYSDTDSYLILEMFFKYK